MAFGNEVRDFIDAFQAGAKIKDVYKRRKIDEQEAKDKVSIAQMRQDAADKKFGMVYDQNERKLKAADERYKSDYGLRASAGDRAERDLTFRQGTAAAASKRLADEDARKARAARIKEDPTSILDEQTQALPTQGALPTGVTSASRPTQGIPTEGPGEAEGGAEDTGEPQPEKKVGISAAIPRSASLPGVAGALHGGLTYLQQHFGLDQGGVPGQGQSQDGARRLFEGEGSMTPEEKKQVDSLLDEEDRKNGVDPQKLTEGMRAIRRLTRTRDKLLARGDVKTANQMAAAIIQESRGNAAMLGMSALKKLQGGDINGAAQDVITAHDQIPDGRKVEFDPKGMTFRVSDEESGKAIQEGKVTPEMIYSVANGFKDGSGFYKVVMDAAAHDPSMQTKGAPAKPVKPEELKAKAGYEEPVPGEGQTTPDARTTVTSELMSMQAGDGTPAFKDEAELQKLITPQGLEAISGLGEAITKYNDVPADKAGRLALSIVNPDLDAKGEAWNFKAIRLDPNIMEIQTQDGTRLKLPTRIAAAQIKTGHDRLTLVAQKIQGDTQAASQRRADNSKLLADTERKIQSDRAARAEAAKPHPERTPSIKALAEKQGAYRELNPPQGIPVKTTFNYKRRKQQIGSR